MDEQLKSIVDRVKILAESNLEFHQEMQKMFGETVSASVVSNRTDIRSDIHAIRAALEIRAINSISYDFVEDHRLRDQLIIDNLRMENSAIDLRRTEQDRFYTFCVNAFYQLENIINYFFFQKYPQCDILLDVIESGTSHENYENLRYHRTGNEKNVADIPIVHKINAFCNLMFPGEPVKLTLGQLRQVRNEGEHRCMVIREDEEENPALYRFFKYNTFNTVRIYLKKVVRAVKENILVASISKPISVKAEIKTMLPGSCFVSYEGAVIMIPQKLFSKVAKLMVGEEIQLVMENEKILDVII